MKEISKILKETRKSAGITQKQAAQILGVDPAVLSRIENGKQTPHWDFVERALTRLDIKLEDYKERATRYKVNPRYEDAFDKVLTVFSSLPAKHKRHLVSELVEAI